MPSSNQQPARRNQQAPANHQQEDPTVKWDQLHADLNRNQPLFAKLLGCERSDDPIADRFISTCYHAVWSKPDLISVGRDSLLLAFAESAVVGLSLNPTAKEAYLEIRSGKARFATQYQGLAKLIRKHNDVDFLFCDAVRRGDHFRQIGGSNPMIEHVSCELGSEPPGYDDDESVLATYAVVKMKGATRAVHEVARRSDIMKAMSMSKGAGGKPPSPAWVSWFWRMALKVAIRRLANLADTSGDVRAAIAVEDSDTLVSDGVRQVFGDIVEVEAPRHQLGTPGPTDELGALVKSSGPVNGDPRDQIRDRG